jgi:hypothetical protein
MDIKEEIFNFISTHEAQVSHDMDKKDENIKVTFTTFGNRAGCRAVYDVIQMLEDDMKLKVVDMMRNKRVQ